MRSKNITEQHGGTCDNTSMRKTTCTTNITCPNDCAWSEWSDSTPCSKSCGYGQLSGIKKQHRSKLRAEVFGENCDDVYTRYIGCTTNMKCPLDCEWNEWQDDTPCTKSCGLGSNSGIKTQTRTKKEDKKYAGL